MTKMPGKMLVKPVCGAWMRPLPTGPMAALGWRAASSGGYGPKGFGTEIAQSRAFSVCQVEKVFEHVCFRPPQTQDDSDAIESIATLFETNGYRMKSDSRWSRRASRCSRSTAIG